MGRRYLFMMMVLVTKHLHVQTPSEGLPHYFHSSQFYIIETNTNRVDDIEELQELQIN